MRLHLFRGLAALLLAATAYGQTSVSQEISGVIEDANAAIIPNVTVTVKHTGTGFTRSSMSNDEGWYVISNLPIGDYEVTAQASGFKKVIITNVALTLNLKLPVNFKLEIGNATDSMTARADAVQVETNTGQIGRLVTGEQTTQIPFNGRNFPQLLQLLPGVSTTYNSGFGLFTASGLNTSSQSINGSRTDTLSWNVDGADNKDNGGSGNNFVAINLDAIAELNVLTANYNAEYGYSSGAVVNVAVRSGMKAFHGGAYEYLRSDSIQARAFNATSKPELHYNNFGWNLGGPVFVPGGFNHDRDKLFFFFSNEYRRLRQGSVNTWTVPEVAQRNGDFSALPYYRWPKDPLTGQSFPNGIIPKTRFSPNSSRLLQNYPSPNFSGSGGNDVFTTVAPLNTSQFALKADYSLSPRNQISIHGMRDYYTSTQNQTQLIEYDRNIPSVNTGVQWTFVSNPKTVHVAAFAYTGNAIKQNSGIKANPLFISDYTRSGEGINYPTLYGASNAIPSFNVSGYSSLTSTPINPNSFDRNFNGRYGIFKLLWDTHSVRAGVMAISTRRNLDSVPALNGTFNFNTAAVNSSGNALADAVLGNFYTYTEAGSTRQGWYRFNQVEPYIQDDWKLSKRISVSFGVRYSYMPPWYSELNNTSTFLPDYYNSGRAPSINNSTGAIVTPNTTYPYNGLVLGGNSFPGAATGRVQGINDSAVKALFHKLPKGTAKTDWRAIAPRFGFAYDLTGQQTTVIRGGAGVFYERIPADFLAGSVNNPPFNQQSQVSGGSVDSPAGGTLQTFPSTISSHYLNLKIPRTTNWSLGVQQKVSKDMVLDVAYVASSAIKLLYQEDLNQLRPGTTQAHSGVNVNALRPYRGYADIYEFVNGASFTYSSAQVQIRKQFTSGGVVNVAYTYSKGRTDANTYDYQPMNSYDLHADWGPSSYNRRNIVAISYVYPLPFWRAGSEWYKKAFGGWQISGVTMLQNGLPTNVVIQGDAAGIGISGNQRPNLTTSAQYSSGKVRTQYLNPDGFTAATAGHFGDLASYGITLPFFDNWDASVQKSFRLTERIRTDLRGEFFNVANHLSYTSVGTTLGASNFGQVTGATEPRTLEFAIHFSF